MRKFNWRSRATKACAASLLWAAAIALPAQTFTVLRRFNFTDGAGPIAGLVQATDGSFYGATSRGGLDKLGTIFKITPGGTLTTLIDFDGTQGALPSAALIQGTDGNLYGTTELGGANGSGTVFKITPSGTLTMLYSFCSQAHCTDGSGPNGALYQSSDGNFYGTASGGGANHAGTVFKLTPLGHLTTLYSFCAQSFCSDGNDPTAGLVQAGDGNFYGTTYTGGTRNNGSVFKVTPGGTLTTLYSFCAQANCLDGSGPYAGLVQGADGNLYGSTTGGGNASNLCSPGCGTIFKITRSGLFTIVHSFNGPDGGNPYGTLIQATDGNFYGTSARGGVNGAGAVFKITPSGELTTLNSYCSQSGCADGQGPVAGLIQDTNGTFYGTTTYGGRTNSSCPFNCGTVFSLSVGLGPFAETNPASGEVESRVSILGTNLTGSTCVTFNGTAAVFTVNSASLITTAVPAGATTGTVEVVTPSGTLKSNVPFRVLP
jgi:uncharacterized repeat protein (TIGR03803 family)